MLYYSQQPNLLDPGAGTATARTADDDDDQYLSFGN
jgi:hypothetical protein